MSHPPDVQLGFEVTGYPDGSRREDEIDLTMCPPSDFYWICFLGRPTLLAKGFDAGRARGLSVLGSTTLGMWVRVLNESVAYLDQQKPYRMYMNEAAEAYEFAVDEAGQSVEIRGSQSTHGVVPLAAYRRAVLAYSQEQCDWMTASYPALSSSPGFNDLLTLIRDVASRG